MTVRQLPPKEKTLIAPEGGWKERTYYVVEVAFNPCNPIHRAILYVGFFPGLDKEKGKTQPFDGGYTTMFQASWEGEEHPKKAHYLKVVSEITDMAGE